MPVLAVLSSSPESVEGGHVVLARALVAAARECGYDAHLVLTPDCQFGRQASSYLETWRTDVSTIGGQRVDQVISLRYPSYAVRHDRHVVWVNHLMREYYDLWPRFSTPLSKRGRMKERVKRVIIRAVDGWLLKHHVSDVVAESYTIARRLRDDFGISADTVLPPPPQRAYRCDEYGDYIFTVSRLTPLKRIDLLIRALATPAAAGVRAVIAGEGESRASLEALIVALGLSDRISLVGRLSDEEMLDHYARCRAVCFTPVSEDYGFVTVEAFASRKAVITCPDSGGPADLVRHGENGLIAEPTPDAIAAQIAIVMGDSALAERMGAAGALDVAGLTWPAVVKRLVIV